MEIPVATILERIRDAVDMNDDGEEGFVTNDMLLRWFNAAVPRFISMMMRAGWVWSYTSMSIEPDGRSEGYSSDGLGGGDRMMCILGCYELVSEFEFRPLRAIHPLEAPFSVAGTRAVGFFAVDSSNTTFIQLRPNPSTGFYGVLYVPEPDTYEIDDDFDCPAGFEEWLVLECARQATGREESRNVTVEERKMEIEREVERMASDRLFAQGPRVRDVRSETFDPSVFLTDSSTWYWL